MYPLLRDTIVENRSRAPMRGSLLYIINSPPLLGEGWGGEGIISTATQRPTSPGSEAEGGEDAVVLALASYKCEEGVHPVRENIPF